MIRIEDTYGSREWAKLTKSVCLTNLTCASKKIDREMWLNLLYAYATGFSYSYSFNHIPHNCLGYTGQIGQTHEKLVSFAQSLDPLVFKIFSLGGALDRISGSVHLH